MSVKVQVEACGLSLDKVAGVVDEPQDLQNDQDEEDAIQGHIKGKRIGLDQDKVHCNTQGSQAQQQGANGPPDLHSEQREPFSSKKYREQEKDRGQS